MIRMMLGAMALMCFALAGAANAGEARFLKTETGLFGSTKVQIAVPGVVPYRVFLRDGPPRLVVDVQVPEAHGEGAVQAGRLADGWSRFVLRLGGPKTVREVDLSGEILQIKLVRAGWAKFDTEVALAPQIALAPTPRQVPRTPPLGLVRIVLDPGHGGVDPGAYRAGVAEKDIALAFGLELANTLKETGRYDVLLTRETDRFVTLDDRVAFARAAGADLFLSLHANTVKKGTAKGAAIYVASRIASDPASAALALLENRADTQAGAPDPTVLDSDIRRTVMDMAQRSTGIRAKSAAEQIVAALSQSTGVIRSRPLRAADFRVLRAPDMPSLLLELGFLSDQGDRTKMTSVVWRRRVAAALAEALDNWVKADAAFLALMQE